MVPTKKLNENEHYIKKIKELLNKLNIKYTKLENYLLSFVHKSLVNERPDLSEKHNERLEFLWDAVLELVITEKLYIDFPEEREWVLTDYRSSLVKWEHLWNIAKKLWFQSYLLLWKWEEKWWWRENYYILANTLEAFIWALYLDLGYNSTSLFILEHIYSDLENIIKNKELKDYKSLFQEFAQSKFGITPTYELLEEKWLDHDKIFKFWVYLKDKFLASWIWSNKKKSQEDAAKNAYIKFLQDK